MYGVVALIRKRRVNIDFDEQHVKDSTPSRQTRTTNPDRPCGRNGVSQ